MEWAFDPLGASLVFNEGIVLHHVRNSDATSNIIDSSISKTRHKTPLLIYRKINRKQKEIIKKTSFFSFSHKVRFLFPYQVALVLCLY